ncbi:MAG: M28 family peptidase [Planctomycetota bacterium]|jgi:hypothetical protein|nr:M28 family peptidase [Planctomycetota bacterium]
MLSTLIVVLMPLFPQQQSPEKILVSQLSLESYKSTLKSLTKFGDRRQGTERNRQAIDWIEQQFLAYGYDNVERMNYSFPDKSNIPRSESQRLRPWGKEGAVGGGRRRGLSSPTSVNRDPDAQQNLLLRELNKGPVIGSNRQQIYCTKIGSTRPHEMYIVAAHMDGIGYGEACNDDGSGTALVLELARIFGDPNVVTECSIRFVLFNNEESGLNGSYAYVDQRYGLQGIEDPPGSGKYPEPKWLGMIQHDMMLFDHGMPLADGSYPEKQRPEADVNIEFQMRSDFVEQSQKLAWEFQRANEKYASKYPASVGAHMTNTDSVPFMDKTAAISLRENERGTQVGNGWNPHWHQASDLFSSYSDDDFNLGLNAAQTTLAAVSRLSGASL